MILIALFIGFASMRRDGNSFCAHLLVAAPNDNVVKPCVVARTG
jgi:hypothetical protein